MVPVGGGCIGKHIALKLEVAPERGEFRWIAVAHIAGSPCLPSKTWNSIAARQDENQANEDRDPDDQLHSLSSHLAASGALAPVCVPHNPKGRAREHSRHDELVERAAAERGSQARRIVNRPSECTSPYGKEERAPSARSKLL